MLFMGKSTISMTIFQFANCKRLPEGKFYHDIPTISTFIHGLPIKHGDFP